MPSERDERLYVSDVLTAIDRILAYTAASDRAAFLAAGTRDRVIHSYFRVDLDIVWDIVEKELPGLRTRMATLLAML